MYGKFFASTFTGSMMGSGPTVFAVWGYVIANAVNGQVELNPRLVAAVIGCSQDDVQQAIGVLAAPDPNSRSPTEDGRRLVQEGQFAFRVTNHAMYRQIRNEDDRREYNRIKKQESRLRARAAGRKQSRRARKAEGEAAGESLQQQLARTELADDASVFDHQPIVDTSE